MHPASATISQVAYRDFPVFTATLTTPCGDHKTYLGICCDQVGAEIGKKERYQTIRRRGSLPDGWKCGRWSECQISSNILCGATRPPPPRVHLDCRRMLRHPIHPAVCFGKFTGVISIDSIHISRESHRFGFRQIGPEISRQRDKGRSVD
jgi:hypothetical protein